MRVSLACPEEGEKAAEGKMDEIWGDQREMRGREEIFLGGRCGGLPEQGSRLEALYITKSSWKLLCLHLHPTEFLEVVPPAYW